MCLCVCVCACVCVCVCVCLCVCVCVCVWCIHDCMHFHLWFLIVGLKPLDVCHQGRLQSM